MIIRQRSLFVILWLALIWVVCSSAWAETIRLKNGRIFEGEIVDEGGDEVKIIMKSGLVTFSRDEIDSIGDRRISEKDIKEAIKSLSDPTPVKKPVLKKASSAVASKPAHKKKQKAIVKVKKQGTHSKAAQPETLPAVAADTATVTRLSASTDTAPPVSSVPILSPTVLPARPQKELSASAKAAIVTIAIAIIAFIAFLIKRIKRRSKE